MTTLRVTFHSEAVRLRHPDRVAGVLNHSMCDLSSQGQFVCFFYGTYSFEDHCLNYCNAGMEPPILIRAAPGTFFEWMKRKGKLGGQHKVPRVTMNPEMGDELVGIIVEKGGE